MSNSKDTRQKNPNVPTLRFGFIEDWHKCKLPEVAVFLPGLTYSPSNIRKDGKIVLRSSNIQNGLLDLNDIVCVDASIVKESLSVKPFDVLMCIRNGSKKLVGKTALIKEENPQLTWGAFMAIVRPTNVPKSSFVFHFLNSRSFFKQIFPDTNTATVNQITAGIYKGCYISIPSIYEQLKISEFLDLIDRRITVQNKIIEALGGLKKAIYERIFGSDFLGATLQPLGDFMEIPKLEKEIRPDRNRLITVKLNEAGVVRNTNVESLKMSGTIYYKRSAGQFIYGKQNLFHGAFGIVPKELNGFCSSADVPSLSFNGSIEPSLLIRAISYCAYNWEKFSSGTGSKRIHETTLLGLTVPIPAKEHIGRCKKLLDLIDHKIECERKLLRLTEMQKRYLLAEMFI